MGVGMSWVIIHV